MNQFEQLISTYVNLDNPSNSGWQSCLHTCDHGRKGNRAAFLFEDDSVAFHCFNCGIKTTFKLFYDHFPKKLEQVLNDFGIPKEEINKLKFTILKKRDKSGQIKSSQKKEGLAINPKELPIPDHFYLLSAATEDDKWAEIARAYLEDRKIDHTSYPFFLSTGIPVYHIGPECQKVLVKAAQKWTKRVIIPIYKDEKLIYYQGRDLTEQALKKYESPSAPKERIIYGFDQLFINEDRPLYVVEGFFDAFLVQGVALLGNELTEPQIVWLNKSRRDKVYVPDKGPSGAKNAQKALKQGWKISFPVEPNSSNEFMDISDAIIKYGQLYIHNTLREQSCEGIQAKVNLKLFRKKNDKNRSTRENT